MKANRPSATAQVVAASLLCLAHEARYAPWLADDPARWREHVMTGSATAKALRASAHWAATRAFWRWLERHTLPGAMAHYARRKARIEWHCREALAQGARRVVVLGAGLDTLALRLAPAYPQVQWLELDHPATQALKRAGLARSGAALPPNLHWQAVDLGTPQALHRAMHDWPARPTVFVAEGLLMYLSPAQVGDVIGEVCGSRRKQKMANGSIPHDVAKPASADCGTRLIATYMQRNRDGRASFTPQSPWVACWLRWRGEPFRWAEQPAHMPDWAQRHGLQVLAHEAAPFDAAPFDAAPTDAAHGIGSLRGENLIVARVR